MPNNPQAMRDKPIRSRAILISGESSDVTINGEPLAIKASDATKVVTAKTATAAAATSLFAGLAVGTANPGEPQEFVCSGYHPSARFAVRTRAASSDSWSVAASLAAGVYLTIDTANRAIAYSGAGAASAGGVLIALVNTRASVAGAATATNDTALVQYSTAAVWVRNLG